jgi:two-component system, NtrC family, response regulator HydG
MQQNTILIVDDSYDMLEVLRRQLTALSYQTFQASTVGDAIDILQHSAVDLLITDLQMPGINGMQLVKYVAEHFPEIPVLVITGYPSVAGAVEAVRSGAIEYLVKPFTNTELKTAVSNTVRQKIHVPVNRKSHVQKDKSDNYWGIIGRSEAMDAVLNLIERVKNNNVTVLITGESGTGKELVARAIHYSSRFSKAPFVAVNCGAIPENLLESELFGFVKGSFTGAHESRAGFFQAADGGTIFLDEIGSASPAVQTRLLRVIQEKEIMMIGANRSQKVDVRIIAATNSDLQRMTKTNDFREDLFYRLNVIALEIPPLRNRKEDIPLLVHHFMQKYAKEYQKSKTVITDKAMELFLRHNWPGNIRELENIIHRSLIMSDGEIGVAQLDDYLKMPQPQQGEVDLISLQEAEKLHILKVLEVVNNNKTKAAKILGIDRKTLRQKIQ